MLFYEVLALIIIPRVRKRETKQGFDPSTAIFLTGTCWKAFNLTQSLSESKQTIFVSTFVSMLRRVVSARWILPLRPCPLG